MKLARILGAIGAIGIIGAAVLPASDAAAFYNENIKLLGQDFHIAVHPPWIEFDLVPGTTTGDSFRVRNAGSEQIDLKIGIAPMKFSGETTMLGTPRNEIVDWTTIAFVPAPGGEPACEPFRTEAGALFVHMPSKEECWVKFSTVTPSNAPFGEQYMNIFFQKYDDLGDEGMQTVYSIGVNVFGTNRMGGGGAGDMCGKIIKQRIPFWVFEGPLVTTATIENCGRLNFHATIKIEVHNLFGALVYEEERPVDRIIAADTQREMRDIWNDTSIGIYKTRQTVEFLGETYIKEGWTFLIPLWLILLVLICILVAILAIVHDWKKKQQSGRRK